MILFALAISVAQAPRTGPIDPPASLKEVSFRAGQPFAQIGRIQVAIWQSSSTKPKEALAADLAGWSRKSPNALRFVRLVRGVLQNLSLNEVYANKVRSTTITLTEAPPEDGSIPRDWPLRFKRGLFRILPEPVSILKGRSPERIQSTNNPVGRGVESIYRLQGDLKGFDRVARTELKGWKRVDARGAIRYSRSADLPTSFLGRRLDSVTLSEMDGSTQVVVRWSPGPGDDVGSSRRAAPAKVKASPLSSFGKSLVGSPSSAHLLPEGAFGGRVLAWKVELPIKLSQMRTLLSTLQNVHVDDVAGARPGTTADHFSATLRTDRVVATASVTVGRTEIRKAPPPGWRPTPDFEGFWDEVNLDRDRWITVHLSEKRGSAVAPWPKAFTYSWPLPGIGEQPFAEMARQPDQVIFPRAGEPLQATWELRVGKGRSQTLLNFSYSPGPKSKINQLLTRQNPDGTVVIYASYR